MLSLTEENYLKGLFHLTYGQNIKKQAGTNELAAHLGVKPASTNDMLKKLKEKKLVNYEKYGKIQLTVKGKNIALEIIRKHRLWETFLYDKLGFSWDEVHDVAEQLEHIQSEQLINRLDKFLGFPKLDPHGDPIPNEKGEMLFEERKTLSQIKIGKSCKMVAVKDNTASFLKYVAALGLGISDNIKVISRQDFDNSMEIEIAGKKFNVSHKFSESIYVV